MEKSNTKLKKKREIPHAMVILFAIIVIATICTWIIPAGQYDTYVDEATGRNLVDPASFHYVDKTPVGLFKMFVCIQGGLIDSASIVFLIFSAFSCLYLIEATGAIDAAIAWMLRKTNGGANTKSSNAIIIIIMIVFSVWGSTGTFSYEEVVAFVPIFVAVAIALGYDAMVGVAISVIPVGIGFASATVNPFTIGVAQTIAELKMFSGIEYRIIILAVMTATLIVYTMVYANRIKKDPTKSVMYGIDMGEMAIDESKLETEFTLTRKLTLLTLFVGVICMAVGLLKFNWYVNQCAAIFMIVSIVCAIINRWSGNHTAEVLIAGLGKGVFSALIVGIARAVLQVMSAGNIIHTIIHACAGLLEGLSLYVSSVGMLVFQTVLNFLVPSGSGQAAVSMPIMTPIADIIGMNRQIAVLAFQFGDGFSNLLWPTGFMVIACAMAKIPLNKYYKWLLPFFGICFVLQGAFLMIAVAMNYS